jgi:ribosomal protein L33
MVEICLCKIYIYIFTHKRITDDEMTLNKFDIKMKQNTTFHIRLCILIHADLFAVFFFF